MEGGCCTLAPARRLAPLGTRSRTPSCTTICADRYCFPVSNTTTPPSLLAAHAAMAAWIAAVS